MYFRVDASACRMHHVSCVSLIVIVPVMCFYLLHINTVCDQSQQIIPAIRKDINSSRCDVVNFQSPVNEDYPCKMMNISPSTWICLYQENDDAYVSATVWKGGVYEKDKVTYVMNVLQNNTELGFIDIGANLGTYSLAIAAMGRTVVSVEANVDTAARFHKAIMLGGLHHRITLVQNAISNQHGNTLMRVHKGAPNLNRVIQGNKTGDHTKLVTSIILDDLLPLIHFGRAVMKIDIEGSEHRAMASAEKLFHSVDICMVQMEMNNVIKYNLPESSTNDKTLFLQMLDFLYKLDYKPYRCAVNHYDILQQDDLSRWPKDVCWKKKIPACV